jgi:hypothetical protein
VLTDYRCGAIAQSDTTWNQGRGDTENEARADALNGCGRGCKIRAARCRY